MGRRGEHVGVEEEGRDREHDRREGVAAADHLAPSDRVEERAEQQRPEQVAQGEGEEVDRRAGGGLVVEVLQHERVGEEDRVVEEALRDHQRRAEHRACGIHLEEDVDQLPRGQPLPGLQPHAVPLHVEVGQLLALGADLLLDAGDDLLGLVELAVGDHPPRALRDVPPQVDDAQTEDRAEEEGDPPADALSDDLRVEQPVAGEGTDTGTEPVRPVDGQVDPAAVLAGDELVDRRVDRRVLTTDARAGDEAQHEEDPHVRGEGRQTRGDEVDRQGHREELLAAQGVGHPTEEERADHLTDEVDRAGEADIGRGHVERLLEAARGDDLDLETVEDPCGPETEDHHPVEPRPRHVVHPGRDQAPDRLVLRRCLGHADLPSESAGHTTRPFRAVTPARGS